MSFLHVFNENNPNEALLTTQSANEIADALSSVGIRFEQWEAKTDIQVDTSQDSVVAAYREEVDRLMVEGGYQTVDVISLAADNPAKDDLRKKFLDEHTHSEDEVRFFVRGDGMFYLHISDKVYAVLCESGDLISVPANITHWFDMGDQPNFTAIRLFTNPEGWVAQYTQDDIASRFPKHEDLVQARINND